MLSPMWLFFVLCLSLTPGLHLLEDEEKPDRPYFPAEYKMSGEKISLTTGIITPFEAWYSSESNRSRMDYFGGMVKRYYYDSQLFEFHPEITKMGTNKTVCFKKKLSKNQEDFLPSLEDFVFATSEQINGKTTSKWISNYGSDDVSGAKVEETLWLSSFDKESQAVPVRYELKTYNNWLGKMSSHTVTNYFTFETSVQSEDFQLENEEKCMLVEVAKGDLETLAFVEPHDDGHVDAVFSQYKDKHNRKYKTKHEHEMRRLIFRKNLEKVLATNHKKLGYTLALNKFADRTEEELHHLSTLRPSDPNEKGTIPFPYEEHELYKLADDFPKEYDMRVDGFITPVQNQGECGSCWAFAMAATIEGALARSNGGRKIQLSEQALIDCAWGYSAYGCEGGEPSKVFYFAMDHGVPTDENYGPYQEMDGYCRISKMPSLVTIKGFTRVTPVSDNALKVALYNHGPISAALFSSDDLQLYSGGIYYDIKCDNATASNHAVTIIGYGEKFGQTYWIVKNSWGSDWGSGGYIMISANNNNCLLDSEPYYVVV